jgi:F-type H+-transporting ATPase subunit a
LQVLASEFSWFSFLPSLPGVEGEGTNLVPFYHSCLAALLILVVALLARLALNRRLASAKDSRDALVPDADLKPRNLMELYTEFIYGICRNELGDLAPKFFPLIAAIFLYILVCNLMGLVPGFIPSTGHIETNIGIAVIVFVVFNIAGLARNGIGYLKHLAGPVLWLAPLIFIIETIGLLARPATLSLRLYGNMFGDHTVLSIFMYELPEQLGLGFLAYGIPVIFLGLGTFVCVVQAFVFSLLTVVYIKLATAHEET